MAHDWLSLAEIARRTGIPESSLRRYVRNFKPHLPQEQSGKRWVFSSETVGVFETIGTAYREGKTTEEIDAILQRLPGTRPTPAPLPEIPSPGAAALDVPPAPPVRKASHSSKESREGVLSSATVADFLNTVQNTMERIAKTLEIVEQREQERVHQLEDQAARQETLLAEQRLHIAELEQKLHRVESLLFLTGDEKTTPLVVKEQLEKLQEDLAVVRQIQEKESVVRMLEPPLPRRPWWRRIFGFGQ